MDEKPIIWCGSSQRDIKDDEIFTQKSHSHRHKFRPQAKHRPLKCSIVNILFSADLFY